VAKNPSQTGAEKESPAAPSADVHRLATEILGDDASAVITKMQEHHDTSWIAKILEVARTSRNPAEWLRDILEGEELPF
jgi:hypothetical protein